MSIPKYKLTEYTQTLPMRLMTSRFNNETWKENEQFRNKIKKKCAYFSPYPIVKEIKFNTPLIVLEMNNDENQLIGIGMLRNIPQNQCFRVYTKEVYNNVLYVGNYYISREKMNEKQLEIIKQIEQICFQGKGHLKRGHGISTFPIRILYEHQEWIPFLINMFRTE
jgi:hypothetical protein